MKTTALLLLLLLSVACASPTAVQQNSFNCGETGLDLSIAAGFDPGNQPGEMGEREFVVEVSNNVHHDVTVTLVRVESSNRGLGSAFDDTDVTIAGGEDHVFHLKASPFGASRSSQAMLGLGVVEFQVMLTLSNGDVYRCPFRAEVR